MLKTLLAGAVLGYFGKKLYDGGKLQPYIAKARTRLGAARDETRAVQTFPEPAKISR